MFRIETLGISSGRKPNPSFNTDWRDKTRQPVNSGVRQRAALSFFDRIMTDLEAFLLHNVEGYLFGDLQRITAIPVPGVGYPVVMAAFAGVELLGALMSPRSFNPQAGRESFLEYWSQNLYPSVASTRDLGDALYTFVRNGIAHAFIPHGQIGIAAKSPSVHLEFDASGLFVINAEQLAEDLMASYASSIKPHITPAGTGTLETTMANNLKDMLASPTRKPALRAATTLGNLAAVLGPSATATTAPLSSSVGPSGPSGAVPKPSSSP